MPPSVVSSPPLPPLFKALSPWVFLFQADFGGCVKIFRSRSILPRSFFLHNGKTSLVLLSTLGSPLFLLF